MQNRLVIQFNEFDDILRLLLTQQRNGCGKALVGQGSNLSPGIHGRFVAQVNDIYCPFKIAGAEISEFGNNQNILLTQGGNLRFGVSPGQKAGQLLGNAQDRSELLFRQ